ncbi:MAG: class I SAM-dependent methyltransferase [Bacteroidota bacterium]|nr:class I SAM-dependent methyltransferase [Bacteroidota bacterium]
MGIISSLIKVASTLAQNPKRLLRVLNNEDDYQQQVIKKYNNKYGLPVIDLLDLFPDFDVTLDAYSYLEGASLPTDMAMLKKFAQSFPECNYFEIGTWRGESIANVAPAAKMCTSLNLSGNEIRALGLPEGCVTIQRFYSKNIPNIKYVEHNSLTFDFKSLNDTFDLIFVDGDHRYDAVVSDARNAFTLLKNEKSIIVFHDYGMSTEKIRWEVFAGILEACPTDKRHRLFHISNTLCAVYLPEGNYPTRTIGFPEMPNKKFRIHLKAEKAI